ncbi:MAG: hypothetical protein RIQ28_1575, partial [Pseudomonadota bacterium]
MKKIAKLCLIGAAALSMAACDKSTTDAGDAQADNMEAAADATREQADLKADAMENRADTL